MMTRQSTHFRAAAILLFFTTTLIADGSFTIDTYTIDGGGGYSMGSVFKLEGTIAQPDAGYLSGGEFELTGGFWSAAVAACACPGDTNADGALNGNDIAQFVQCFVEGTGCQCAELDGIAGTTFADLDALVLELLSGTSCP